MILQQIILLGYCHGLHNIAKLSRRFCLREYITNIHAWKYCHPHFVDDMFLDDHQCRLWLDDRELQQILSSEARQSLKWEECHQLPEDECHHFSLAAVIFFGGKTFLRLWQVAAACFLSRSFCS